MTSTAISSASPAINSSLATVNNRVISLMLCGCASPTATNSNSKRLNLLQRIKSSASDSITIIDSPITSEEEEIAAKIGGKVRVKVPLKVYHIAKVPEVELKGREGKIKEYVAVWKGKHISANLPYKIEFLEKLEGRGDAPVKFLAHLKEDEFDYID